MKRTISTLTMASAALAVGMVLMPLSAAAKKPASTAVVDCESGESIQSVIEKSKAWVPLDIDIRGICKEAVIIRRDDITLRGVTDDAAIASETESGVYVVGGQRIVIENLTLSGPEAALATDSSFVTLNNVVIQGGYNGIDAVDGSNIVLEGCHVTNNDLDGVLIEKSGTLSMANTVVSGNARGGIRLNKNSSSVIWDSDISGNLTGAGLSITDNSSAHVKGSTVVSANGTQGINLVMHSSVRIFSDPVISGNGQNGVLLARDSGAELIGPVTIQENAGSAVLCVGDESSVDVQDFTNIAQSVDCTSF